jgi:uncharacterized peroxidase-related enzyme
MTTLPLIADDVAATAATFQGVRKQLGLVPNLFRVVANSPATLQGYLGLSAALGRGVLPAALREQIALLVAQQNGCDYCLSAHAVIGAGAGLDEAAIQAARQGEAMTEQDTAALALARAVLAGQGRGAEAAHAAAQAAGWNAAAIVEIVHHVALNVFTNSLNNLVGTPIDFPVRSTAA